MLLMHCRFEDLRFRVVNTRLKFTWHLVSLWREFQRACNTSKRASGNQVGSSFTMTLSRWMQSNWAASWLVGTGPLDSPGPLKIATCRRRAHHCWAILSICMQHIHAWTVSMSNAACKVLTFNSTHDHIWTVL